MACNQQEIEILQVSDWFHSLSENKLTGVCYICMEKHGAIMAHVLKTQLYKEELRGVTMNENLVKARTAIRLMV